jgi:GNAT superfamily N-acetyltransferase
MYFRRRGLSWSNSTASSNRAGLRALAGNDPAPGLVAYRDGRAIGWVSIGPRASYDRLTGAKLLAPMDDRPVWSIVCFVVSRRARGSGVGRALLGAAVDYAAMHGATTIEAYPVADERGRVPAASAFHGVQSMFARAGFEVVTVRRFNAASPPRPIMRLELAPAASG